MITPPRKLRLKRTLWKLALRLIPPLIAYPLALTMLLAQNTDWFLQNRYAALTTLCHAAARTLSALSRRKS